MKTIVKAVLDTLRILVFVKGPKKWAILRSYFRIKVLRPGPAETKLLGFLVSYADAGSLRQLYHEIFVTRLYEHDLPMNNPHIVDCGSNVGISILYFKYLYPEASIMGFEASPLVFPLLQKNISQNELRDVAVYQRAVSGSAGSVTFHVNESNIGALNAGTTPSSKTTPIAVEAVRLSDYIDRQVDLLKMDIEGSEESVIEDLANAGKLALIRNIACEYHHHLSGKDRLSQTLRHLEQAGFGYALHAKRAAPGRIQDIQIYAYRM